MGLLRFNIGASWFLVFLILGGVALSAALARGAVPSNDTWSAKALNFLVWRKGTDIGRHDVRFSRDADKLVVETDSEIRVKMLAMTVYSYSQRAREEWKDGRLVRLTVRTVEDGKLSRVDGVATDVGFRISGPGGRHVAPPDILPATYWHPGTALQTRLIDVQTGALLKVNVRQGSVEPVRTVGGVVRSRRYELRGDIHATLWYDLKSRLTKAWYKSPQDGSRIEYRQTPAVSGASPGAR